MRKETVRTGIKKLKRIVVKDSMQKGYSYDLSAPVGKNFDPEFKPELTPEEMLELGVFCGKYMTDTQKSSQRVGSNSPNFLHRVAIVRSITLGLMPANPSPFGRTTDGYTKMIQGDGFSGIAAISWVGGCRKKTNARSNAGRHLEGMSHQLRKNCEPGDPFCRPRQRQASALGL